MDTWPITLQQTLNTEGFQIVFGITSIRSDVDVGPAKVRSRFTDAVDTYTTEIFLDFDQWGDLKDFYKTILVNGTLPFLFHDPMTDTDEVFRFASPPTVQPLGGRVFRINMNWEKLP